MINFLYNFVLEIYYYYYYYGIKKTHQNGVIEYSNDIFIIKNQFTNEMCNELIEKINKYEESMKEEIIEKNQNVQCKHMSTIYFINNNIDKEYFEKLDKELFNKVTLNTQKIMQIKKSLKIEKDDGYKLRKIHGYTKTHTDGILEFNEDKKYLRCLTMIIQLNNNFEGGIYDFPEQNVKIRLDKGDMIFFPPFWTHPHGVSALEKNTFRYTIHSWFFCKF